jgi:hypothetical protein
MNTLFLPHPANIQPSGVSLSEPRRHFLPLGYLCAL